MDGINSKICLIENGTRNIFGVTIGVPQLCSLLDLGISMQPIFPKPSHSSSFKPSLVLFWPIIFQKWVSWFKGWIKWIKKRVLSWNIWVICVRGITFRENLNNIYSITLKRKSKRSMSVVTVRRRRWLNSCLRNCRWTWRKKSVVPFFKDSIFSRIWLGKHMR